MSKIRTCGQNRKRFIFFSPCSLNGSRCLLDITVRHTLTHTGMEVSNENIHVAALCRYYGELLAETEWRRFCTSNVSAISLFIQTLFILSRQQILTFPAVKICSKCDLKKNRMCKRKHDKRHFAGNIIPIHIYFYQSSVSSFFVSSFNRGCDL